MDVVDLPHLNATLNATAALLLVVGYRAIRRRQETLHKRLMLGSFVVSIAFLISYLIYHFHVPTKRFPTSAPSVARIAYYVVLASHVVLAAAVPFLASVTIYLGWRDRRAAHRKWAVWTFPIWLYVSVTGVVVYIMLYWIFVEPVGANDQVLQVLKICCPRIPA